jgi:pyruvate dehydrogenase E2 component (dihydrolipoamide acetyltransferase)
MTGDRVEAIVDDGTAPAGGDELRPLSGMRKAIAAAMTASAAIPQFTLDRRVDLAAASALRAEQRAAGVPVSWEDFVVAAAAKALRRHRSVNSRFEEGGIREFAQINVGLATAVEGGLINPAIIDADSRSLADLALERKRLRASAKEGGLKGSELYAATFSVSNLGPFGVDRFRALVIPGQAAILATGRVTEEGGPSIDLSLSCDHRVLDGGPAAEFLGSICDLLAEPAWMV